MTEKPIMPNLEKIYLKRSNKETLSKTEYGIFKVLSSDYIGKKFIAGEHYEHDKIKKALEYINVGDTVLDVGANIGVHTIPYIQKIGKLGTIHAFEPQGLIYQLLEDNVNLNCNYPNVHLYHMAIGHNECETTMSGFCDGKPIDYHRSQQTNYGGISLGKHGEKIVMRTIDSFDFDRVNFIKIDVEGAEKLVIWGARETIRKHRPVVFFEENWKKITNDMKSMYKLSNEIVNFDIRNFFLNELKYSDIIKIGSNYMAVP